MKRYNIFNRAHKALRALLYNTALRLQQTDFADTAESTEVLEQLSVVTELLGQHSETEKKYIVPAIEAYEPAVIASFNYEYAAELPLAKWLLHAIEGFEYLQSPEERELAGIHITSKYIHYMMFNLRRMAKEEDVMNSILWNYYDDNYLASIENTIAATVSEDIQMLVAKWMMRGLNKSEIIAWMKSVERNGTCKVCETLIEMAETELSQSRFKQIETSLTEGSLVA